MREGFGFRSTRLRPHEIRRLLRSYGVWGLARKSVSLVWSSGTNPVERKASLRVISEWPPLMPPLLTLIVPVGPNPTTRLLKSLSSQELPEWLSIVAVGRGQSLEDWKKWSLTAWANRRLKLSALDVPGPSLKRNHGAKLSGSPYLLFVDEDDELNIEHLSEAMATVVGFEDAPWTVHQFPYEVLNGGSVSTHRKAGVFLHHSSTIIPRPFFSHAGGYPDCEAEDAIFLARLVDFPQKFHADSRPFFRYHRQADGRSRWSSYRSEKDLFGTLVGLDSLSEQDGPLIDESLSLDRFAMISARKFMTTPSLWELIRIICQGEIGAPSKGLMGRLQTIQKSALSKSQIPAALKDERRLLLTFLLDALKHPKLLEASGNQRVAMTEWPITQAVRKFGITVRGSSRPSCIKLEVIDRKQVSDMVLAHYLQALRVYQSIRLVDSKGACGSEIETVENVRVSASDRYFASRLLRIGQESRTDERKLAGFIASARLRELLADPDEKLFRLYGTGPSASNVSELAPGVGGIGVACNSWVKRPDLLAKLRVSVLVAGDPVFHAGPSDYAKKFRDDLSSWLKMDSNHVFVTVTRDAHIYYEFLPEEIRHQILALDMRTSLVAASKIKLSAMHDGAVPPYSNVLPLLMIPVAIIGGAEQIHLAGFDGDHLNSRGNFWTHSTSVQYEELLGSVRNTHSEFFNLDYSDYRETVSSQIDDVLSLVRAIDCKVTSEVPSGHMSLQVAASAEPLHVT